MVSNEKDLVFTSNRSEKTVGIFPSGDEERLEKLSVAGFPNGLAFDAERDRLLAANVSKPDDPSSVTVSMLDANKRILISDVIVPGRTRWTVFDKNADRFYVNISKPSQIVVLNGGDPDGIYSSYGIPATGPHGLDIDLSGRRLFCACDDSSLHTVDLLSGRVSRASDLSGSPDVVFYNSRKDHLYVAVGDPGVIEVYDAKSMGHVQTVHTERGTHTIAYDWETDKVYAFMPETHRASVYVDS